MTEASLTASRSLAWTAPLTILLLVLIAVLLLLGARGTFRSCRGCSFPWPRRGERKRSGIDAGGRCPQYRIGTSRPRADHTGCALGCGVPAACCSPDRRAGFLHCEFGLRPVFRGQARGLRRCAGWFRAGNASRRSLRLTEIRSETPANVTPGSRPFGECQLWQPFAPFICVRFGRQLIGPRMPALGPWFT